MIEFYDAENLVFYDGAGYADHCQLKLKKTVDAPTIQTSVSAPNYEERYESTETIQGDMYIPLLANEYNIGEGAKQSELRCAKRYHQNFGGCPQLGASRRLRPILSAIQNRCQHRV